MDSVPPAPAAAGRFIACTRALMLCGLSLALFCVLAASASAATYSATQTTPVPPASNFAGSAGGDGWAVALSDDEVFNVFHHDSATHIACHKQVDASECWPPRTVSDDDGNQFATSTHPGMSLDPDTGKLYVYGVRTDLTAGVVCIDTTTAATDENPFCGFTALTAAGEGQIGFGASISLPMQVGHRWYAYNYVADQPAGGADGEGAENTLLCFDLDSQAACADQPFLVDVGTGSTTNFFFSPATAQIGDQLFIPTTVGGLQTLACFDAGTQADCAGSWPIPIPIGAGSVGSPFPLLDGTGALQGLCLPSGTDQCFTLTGESTPTPTGMQGAISSNSVLNGQALVRGPRVYVPNAIYNQVECYDASTSATCTNFPRSFSNLSLLYTVNPDPQRPTCMWVNANDGTQQIQNFDAYTGGACGAGPTRVLTSEFVVPQEQCKPTSYESLQVVEPDRTEYTDGTVEFADGAGNPRTDLPAKTIDDTGTVDLTGLDLNTASGLPQFLITLNGASGVSQVTVTLTWSAAYDPACVGEGTEVEAQATTLTTSLSGGDQNGTEITVPDGTAVTDTATLAGDNAGSAGGTVKYTWYSDSACETVASAGSEQPITTPGTMPASAAVTLSLGDYYPVATYSGDSGNVTSASVCGDEVLHVSDDPVEQDSLSVTTTGTGAGFVDSAPAGIDCGQRVRGGHTDCSQDYDEETFVTLTAHPSNMSTFTGFTGEACQRIVYRDAAAAPTTDLTCTVDVDSATSVGAGFALNSNGGGGSYIPPPVVTPPGDGSQGSIPDPVGPTFTIDHKTRKAIFVNVDPGSLPALTIVGGRLRRHHKTLGHLKPKTGTLTSAVTVRLGIPKALRHSRGMFRMRAALTTSPGATTVLRATMSS